MIIGGQTYIDGKLRVPDIRLRDVMVSGQFVLVLEVSVLDVLGKPVLGPVQIFLGHRVGHPRQSLEEDVVFFLVSICITGLSTGHELFLFIIKMISVDVSVLVEKIHIIRIFSQLLHQVKEEDMLIIKTSMLKK